MGLSKQETIEYCRYSWKAITCTSVKLVWTQCMWPLSVHHFYGFCKQCRASAHTSATYCRSEPQISGPLNIVNWSFCKVGSEFNGQNLDGSSLPGKKNAHSDGVTDLLLLPRWKIYENMWLGLSLIKTRPANCILILKSVWHATVHQHPVRAEADIILRCYAPTNSGKSDKVAHSVVESLRGVQTNAQMLRVNCLQHVPDPWRPSSEAWLWKPRNLCCSAARTPLTALNRLNPLLLHIAGQNIE